MSPRVTAILFAIALALGAFIFFYELRDEPGPSASDPAVARIFMAAPADPDRVESISLTTEEGTPARVERREGRWWVVEPVDAPADQREIDAIASTLVNLSSEGVIEEPQAAAVYGLDDETRVVRFRAAGREYGLRLGAKTPVGPNTYVAATDSSQIFIVSTWKISSLAHSLLELRDRRVLPFDPSAVVRVRLRWPGGGVTLERSGPEEEDGGSRGAAGEGVWRMVAPAQWRADDAVVDTLLSDLSFLRAESFVDEELASTETGLDEPIFEVSIELASAQPTDSPAPARPIDAGDAIGPSDAIDLRDNALQGTGEGAGARLNFALGAFVGASGRIARGRDDSLFRVPQELLADLPRRVIDYRHKQLANFPPSQAQSIELIFNPPGRGGAVTVSMVRTETGWAATSSEALAAGMSSRLVRELAQLKAVDIVAESMGVPELAALGLSPARVVVRVFAAPGEDGSAERLCDISLGEADPDKGILAQASGTDAVYRLDYAMADGVALNYGVFVDKFASKEHRDPVDGSGNERVVRP